MKINWNSLGGDAKQKNFCGGGEYGYFLELHNRLFIMIIVVIKA